MDNYAYQNQILIALEIKQMILIYFILAILFIKFLINFSRFNQSKWYYSKYKKYITKPTWGFVEHEHQIVKLFRDAGVEDNRVPMIEPLGYGKILTGQTSVFSNISITREDVVGSVRHMFHQTIGIYRSRMLETINPLYWIESIIFLPKRILNYVGVSSEKVVIKVFQIIYWLFAAIASILYGIYRGNIDLVVKDWITRLLIR